MSTCSSLLCHNDALQNYHPRAHSHGLTKVLISIGHLYSSITSHIRSHVTASPHKTSWPASSIRTNFHVDQADSSWKIFIIWDALQPTQNFWLETPTWLCKGGFKQKLCFALQMRFTSSWAVREESSWPVMQRCYSSLGSQGADSKFICLWLFRNGVNFLKPASYFVFH